MHVLFAQILFKAPTVIKVRPLSSSTLNQIAISNFFQCKLCTAQLSIF